MLPAQNGFKTPHCQRADEEGGPKFNPMQVECITQLNKAIFPQKSHLQHLQNQVTVTGPLHWDSLSQSTALSARSQGSSDKGEVKLHLNLLGKFIMDNLNTQQNLACRMHPLIGLHSAVIN